MPRYLEITATTTDEQIDDAIPYADMRAHAKERRDDAAAVLAEQGDQTVLTYDTIDGVDVLYSPSFGYAYVNRWSTGVGDSLLIDNGCADSPEDAAAQWQRAA